MHEENRVPAVEAAPQPEIVIYEQEQRPLSFWRRISVDALLVFVSLIWGSTFLVVQDSIRVTKPFTFLAIRFGIGALVLALVFHKRLRRITRADVSAGLTIGLFLFAAYALQTVGLQYTTTSMAGFLTGLYVPFVPLLSILILRQKPTLGATIGIVFSLVGLALLSLNGHLSVNLGIGELLVLGCSVANALHVVSVSKFAPKLDAINLAIIQIAFTALLSALCMPITREPLVMPPLPVWGSALFLGIAATAFALLVVNRVQQFVSSTRATLIYALEPVWAAIFGFFAGERLGTLAWIGCTCILLAMIIGGLPITLPRSRKRFNP
ncbi:MAG TPA: DMT family transporter [Ktedonobacteraceae bacterium]|jgi:drug/metabolite transporter (DMT)-like permease|nr:DMT family transporter [Ktedonobacteraceae bacterium]